MAYRKRSWASGDPRSLLLVSVVLLSACSKGSISGSVKDGGGEAVGGATVQTSPATQSRITNVNGKYTIEDIERQPYAVTASKAGYKDDSGTVDLKATKDATLDLVLTGVKIPGGKISGTVRNSAGQSLSDVTIQTTPLTKTAVSDANGQYSIDDIVKQNYTVKASKIGYADAGGSANLTVSDATVDLTLNLGVIARGIWVGADSYGFYGLDFSAGAFNPVTDTNGYDCSVRYDAGSSIVIVAPNFGGSGIADLGLVASLDAVGSASGTYLVIQTAQLGHAYAVKTREGNYAKFRISDISTANVASPAPHIVIDLAYQSAPGSTRF